MSEKQLEFAREWLEKARHDLFAADTIFAADESPSDIIVFHAQQAVEKSLKGFLTALSIKFPHTHDLGGLVTMALSELPSLGSWREACECARAVFKLVESRLAINK